MISNSTDAVRLLQFLSKFMDTKSMPCVRPQSCPQKRRTDRHDHPKSPLSRAKQLKLNKNPAFTKFFSILNMEKINLNFGNYLSRLFCLNVTDKLLAIRIFHMRILVC